MRYVSSDKEIMRNFEWRFKKLTKFQPPYLSNPNFIYLFIYFILFYFILSIFFLICKDLTICFSFLVDKWNSIPVSRCINFWLLFPFPFLSFSPLKWILPNELAIRSIIYSCIFLKEINCNVFLDVKENCQHNLLYWLLHQEYLFITRESVCFHSMGYLFWNRLFMENLFLIHL